MKRTLTTMMVLALGLSLAPLPASARPTGPRDGMSWHTSMGRGRLGAQVMSLNDPLRQHFGAPRGAGILVSGVQDDSPAQKAGVEVGDVIVSVAGQKIDDAMDVARALADKKQGDKVPVVIVRDGATRSLDAVLDSDASERVEAWDMQGHGDPRWGQRMLRRFARPFDSGRMAPPLPPDGDTVVPDGDIDDWMGPFGDIAERMQRSMTDDGTAKAILDRLEKIEQRLDKIENK